MAIADFQAQKKTFKDVFFRAFGGPGSFEPVFSPLNLLVLATNGLLGIHLGIHEQIP